MHKVLAAVALAVAVPVALAAPALAKSPSSGDPSLSSVLRHHEGFRAEVTYLCIGPKDQDGTIDVLLRRLPEPGASDVDTVATGHDKAKCDGKEREVKIKLPVAAGALQAGRTVQLDTTLTVPGQPVQVLTHTITAQAVDDDSAPTPSSGPTATETPSANPSASESKHPETGTPSPSASSSGSEHSPTETPSASATSSESEHPESEHPESEHPETEKPSPSSTPTS
jgi:hypothetical protein